MAWDRRHASAESARAGGNIRLRKDWSFLKTAAKLSTRFLLTMPLTTLMLSANATKRLQYEILPRFKHGIYTPAALAALSFVGVDDVG